ncbi:hypothetical protein RF11_09703 [Thelohanellus kitauei]|uniref:Uncharacterized protein n=1 Tax=Thelohanellus kitauei TaxID=669202 RepID=A0A0C2N223_THEKT|nr:hypothetical protein RF11_09703 [Thelohanellus kitauei]
MGFLLELSIFFLYKFSPLWSWLSPGWFGILSPHLERVHSRVTVQPRRALGVPLGCKLKFHSLSLRNTNPDFDPSFPRQFGQCRTANQNCPYARAASAPGQQLAAVPQQLTCILRVVKNNAGTQSPPKYQEGCPSTLKARGHSKSLARASRLLTLADMRVALPKNLLLGDWPTSG